MDVKKNKHIILFISFLAISAIASIMGLAITYYLTIKQVPIDEAAQEIIHSASTEESNDLLEEGTVVRSEELRSYYNYTLSELSFNSWLEQLVREDSIQYDNKDSKSFFLKKDVPLLSHLKNNCNAIHCLQHRISFDELPSSIWKTLIGIEDKRFLDHPGFDLYSMIRALIKDLQKMKFDQGASTITQQLIRTLYLNNEKSLERKFKEIIISHYIENKLSKEKILETYFNEVFWGAFQGVRLKGIYTASLYYFDKRPKELTNFEAIILVSMLKGPSYFNPTIHIDRLKNRVVSVSNSLISDGLAEITAQDFWKDQDWKNWQNKMIYKVQQVDFLALWLATSVPSTGLRDFEKYILIKKAKDIEKSIKKEFGNNDFAFKVAIGKLGDEDNLEKKIFKYYSKVERSLSHAIFNEKHQIGSIIKPIVYQIFNNNQVSWDDTIELTPITLQLRSGQWSPKEAKKNNLENVTVREALLNSFNVPVIRLAQKVGMNTIENELKDFVPELKVPLEQFPSQLLGSIELSLGQVFNMYSKFIQKICRDFGAERETAITVLLDPKKTTVRGVVSQELEDLSFFGKTGTTNKGLDNWFVSYDGRNLYVIWFGLDGDRIQKTYPLYGSKTAFGLFQDYVRNRGHRFDEFHCPGNL